MCIYRRRPCNNYDASVTESVWRKGQEHGQGQGQGGVGRVRGGMRSLSWQEGWAKASEKYGSQIHKYGNILGVSSSVGKTGTIYRYRSSHGHIQYLCPYFGRNSIKYSKDPYFSEA